MAAVFIVISGCYRALEVPVDAAVPIDAPHDLGVDARPVLPDASAGVDATADDADVGGLDAARTSDDASVSLPCGPGIPPYVGDLPCVDAPCTVVSSQVFEPAGCGNERPHVLVRPDGEPEIYYEASILRSGSFHARRTGGTWTTSSVRAFVSSAFALDAAGCGYAWLTDPDTGSPRHVSAPWLASPRSMACFRCMSRSTV